MPKHFNIPVFLPEMACPFRCIYCDQTRITGMKQLPEEKSIIGLIEAHLDSFKTDNRHVEIAFFGGNFTGLDAAVQKFYLEIASRYVKQGRVNSLRLSTRPDYISKHKLDLLAAYPVGTIELGAQSLDEEVLAQCGRGHTAHDVAEAAGLIKQYGFRLGLQMMMGLPGDSHQKSVETAGRIIALGAEESRIYPCLVIRGTHLESLYRQNRYHPLGLQQAVNTAAVLWMMFVHAGVKVIRLGLHPSEELRGEGLVAGPFHPAFKMMVMTAVWRNQFAQKMDWPKHPAIAIDVPAAELNHAIGFKKANRIWLQARFNEVKFRPDERLKGYDFKVNTVRK